MEDVVDYNTTIKHIPILLKCGTLLFIAISFLFWLDEYSSFGLPELVPYTPIKLYGTLIIGFTITILIIGEKAILKKDASTNVWQLTLLGLIMFVIAEVPFQVIRAFSFDSDRIGHFLHGFVTNSIFMAFVSFFIAFQLKTKKTGKLILLIVGFAIVLKLLIELFPFIRNN